MHWFLKLLIYPLLEAIRPEVIVEVGVEVGTVTGPLLRWAQANGAVVHAIDPDPTLNVDRLQAEFARQLERHALLDRLDLFYVAVAERGELAEHAGDQFLGNRGIC